MTNDKWPRKLLDSSGKIIIHYIEKAMRPRNPEWDMCMHRLRMETRNGEVMSSIK